MDAPARTPFAQLLAECLQEINHLRRKDFLTNLALLVWQAGLWGCGFLGAAHALYPLPWGQSLVLFTVIATAFTVFGWQRRTRPLTAEQLRLGLELAYPHAPTSALLTGHLDPEQVKAWQGPLREVVASHQSRKRRNIMGGVRALIVPLVLLGVLWEPAFANMRSTLAGLGQALGLYSLSIQLVVEQGLLDEQGQKEFDLEAGEPVRLELLTPNLIHLVVERPPIGFEPVVFLKRGDGKQAEVFQSFQLNRRLNGEASEQGTYEVKFAVTEELALVLPSIGSQQILAHFNVKKLPVPEVSLSTTAELQEAWHDDEPLPLNIQVKTKAPLKSVRLLIRDGRQEAKELVHTITTDDMFRYDTTYQLTLEPYVSSDVAEVEIVAEATDGAVPTPLRGYSKPLKVETASAYGRYRKALQTWRELKQELDDAIKDNDASSAEGTAATEAAMAKSKELAEKGVKQAQQTPFFDGLDRVTLYNLQGTIERLPSSPGVAELMAVAEDLNEFLVEHEMVDDRERDRDFFVATRALSRLVDQAKTVRAISLGAASQHMVSFLNERQARWERRVARLEQPQALKSWNQIAETRPFHKPFAELQKLGEEGALPAARKGQTLADMANVVSSYKAWIEELEAAEDKEREERETKRQQGLSSAQEKLRELQKKQGKIAGELDNAAQRAKDHWDLKWPVVRMNQNSNFKETQSLEATVRALAPKAALRLQGAWKAMQETLEQGNKAEFAGAESFADLAGRLLRQAEKDSSAAQKQQGQRRRRRTAGDRYYGQAVHGGDLEIVREYQVDRRYRDEILNEVHGEAVDESKRNLLEDYLRRVIR